MKRPACLLAAALLASAGIYEAQAGDAPPSAAAGNTSAFGELKEGNGRDVVLAMCMPCHSAAVIVASHRSRAGWDQTITKMQKQNGMWPIPAEVRGQILDYLEVTQPPSDPGLEKARETPWANPLYRPNPLW